ncbi:PAS and ANTAR domain-containing protein [Isoptericola sp. NPDC056618]|uniref:PAS and ANTAR domain-containing protein n=1 Tax=unclassified Isoptericola TaxID=2623355 RepID=UPI003665D821
MARKRATVGVGSCDGLIESQGAGERTTVTDFVTPWDVEGTLALGASFPVGRYRFDLGSERWWWSDETFVIHGFQPGDVVPTTELILAHKHPEDRDRVSQVLRQACATGAPFSSVHRIMDAHGKERTLSVVGEGHRDETGAVCELVGYFIDVTEAVERVAAARATASIRASAANRATIEQAKALVGWALGVDDEEAFARLREASNHTNRPLREIAHDIASAAVGPDRVADLGVLLKRLRVE